MIDRYTLPALTVFLTLLCPTANAKQVPIVTDGRAAMGIVVDLRNTTPAGAEVLADAGNWFSDCLQRASGAKLPISSEATEHPALIIARRDAWPQIAHQAGFQSSGYDDYAIISRDYEHRIYVLGNSEEAARFGIAELLRRFGFRWFAPSEKWHVVPALKQIDLDLTVVRSPQLIERRIWYAYGMSGEDLKPLMQDFQRWAMANRLTLRGLTRTGHSYGNIIGRNQEAFANDPDLSAMDQDGNRDQSSVANARKFCFSNPDLIDLVVADRRRLLETNQRVNPAAFMVSVDPSDGQGTCHCENCKQLGTTTDRVFHLANEVARRLRRDDPRAWVGLYAYSSHRLPPTIDVQPNVYVQVALGFNRTQYSLPELVQRWSEKVSAIGLREYYGVQAWDWGLPGRARGSRVGYHKKWIPFYAERNLNGVNAETNANWGAQALGLYVASQLLWNPKEDVERLVNDYFEQLFGEASQPMRSFYARMESAPPLRASTLLPLFDDLRAASQLTQDPAIHGRLTDLKAYMVYITLFRQFDLIRNRNSDRNDAYYDALEPLMNYAWQIRHRDMIHYYALARRLCNGLPLKDGRLEFYMGNKDRDPVWKSGDFLDDAEILHRFQRSFESLKSDGDPTVAFSRYLDRVQVPGEDAGPSRIHSTKPEQVAVSRFRGGLRGFLGASGKQTVTLGIAPTAKPVTVVVTMRDDVIFEREFRKSNEDDRRIQVFQIELPRAFEYRVDISGDFELQVPRETPLVFEASVTRPAWISYSGPHYFYVPRGTRQLIVDANPRLTLEIPGHGRRDLVPADRVNGKSHIIVDVPEGADGSLWHTATLTRGKVMLLNTPPLLSFHRNTSFVPREVSESEGLSTNR